MARLTFLASFLTLSVAGIAHAQTVGDIAARGTCSTAGIEGLSAQLLEAQMCADSGALVAFAPHAGISLTSTRIHPYLQRSARDAVWAASASISIQVNSAFRTLADQYVLYHSGGCALAASPGRSNHETGLAIDVNNYSAARSALERAGCSWLGSTDPVHFDCPGTDGRAASVRNFQHLWNINHPGDLIAEDGIYGPMTADRLRRSPAAGFPTGGCAPTCTAHCEGSVIVGADCGRGDCGAFGAYCSTAGAPAPRCVSVFCVASAAETPSAHDVCLPDGQLATCDGAGVVMGAMACPSATTCVAAGDTASCVPDAVEVDAAVPTPDASVAADSSVRDGGAADGAVSTGDGAVVRSDGGIRPSALDSGCSCRAAGARSSSVPGAIGSMLVLALVIARRRRRG